MGIDANRSRPSPTSTHPDTRSAATTSSNHLGPQARLPQTSSSNPSVPGYPYQTYPFFAYPPPYPTTPPTDGSSSQHQPPAHSSQPPPQPFQPPQPHHAYTVPMPVPMPYPYSYGGYNPQHGYATQPQFYPAHGYHYPPITTYHPAASPSGGTGTTTSAPNAVPASTDTPGHGSDPSKSRSAASGSDGTSAQRPVQSYVGIRPASSQDILSRAHHARNLPART